MLIAEYSYETDIKVQRREAFRLGKEEGVNIGRVEGAEQTKIETAKKFIKMGLPLEQIAEGTGLSKEVVQQLAEENKK